MPKFSITAVVGTSRSDEDGNWDIQIRVPASDGPQAAALALMVKKCFRVTFEEEAHDPFA